jgi:hypothetical protein
MRTSIVLLASVLTATTAHAEKVGVVVTGEAALQPLVASQLERWLHDRGRTLVPGALEPDAVGTIMDCFVLEDIGCARGVVEARAKSSALVYARVQQTQNDDGTREIAVTGHWFQKDHDVISERRVCSQCTDAKLFETVDGLMLSLVHEPPPPAADGSKPDATPASTTAGTSGAEAVPPPVETSSRSVLPYGLMGAGGLALVGGLVMIAADQDPDPNGTQSPTYRDTATAGTVLGIAGAAALGVGVYLWLTDKPHSQPVAAVTRDGAFVGWTGRF